MSKNMALVRPQVQGLLVGFEGLGICFFSDKSAMISTLLIRRRGGLTVCSFLTDGTEFLVEIQRE